jgi:hypothetical protein
VSATVEPLIRDLREELTDQRIAGDPTGASRPGTQPERSGTHLYNWIVVRQ